jgi:hypothetical protein
MVRDAATCNNSCEAYTVPAVLVLLFNTQHQLSVHQAMIPGVPAMLL